MYDKFRRSDHNSDLYVGFEKSATSSGGTSKLIPVVSSIGASVFVAVHICAQRSASV